MRIIGCLIGSRQGGWEKGRERPGRVGGREVERKWKESEVGGVVIGDNINSVIYMYIDRNLCTVICNKYIYYIPCIRANSISHRAT